MTQIPTTIEELIRLKSNQAVAVKAVKKAKAEKKEAAALPKLGESGFTCLNNIFNEAFYASQHPEATVNRLIEMGLVRTMEYEGNMLIGFTKEGEIVYHAEVRARRKNVKHRKSD